MRRNVPAARGCRRRAANTADTPRLYRRTQGCKSWDAAEILVADQYSVAIEVVGVLATPTQYLFPTGMSANVDSIISHSPAILVNQTLFPQLPPNPDTADVPKSLFLISDLDKEEMMAKYNRYGQIQAINDMVASYVETKNGLNASKRCCSCCLRCSPPL